MTFPSSLPSIPRITDPANQWMDDSGIEADVLHNLLATEMEGIAGKVGIDNSTVTSSLDYKVRVDLPASIAAAQAAAIAGAPVQSVAGRTGAVTLSVSDVSGAQAETASSIGSLIDGASEKSVIATGDKIALSDSAASGILKWGSTGDLMQALYLLGMPMTVFQTAIPFFLLPGDGGTNGLTFTGGGGGAFTLSAAPLENLLGGLSGKGCYGYLQANAGGSGCAAGWYYFIPSSDTAGTFYANTYTGGQPQLVGSPTTFAGSPSGRITTPTSEVTAISGINLTPLGNNGEAELKLLLAGDTASGNKIFKIRLGGTASLSSVSSSNPQEERLMTLRNAGSQSSQILSQSTRGTGVAGNTIATSGFTSIDLSGPTTAITMCMQLTANTGCMCYLASALTQKYRP